MTESSEQARIRQLEAENRELRDDLKHALQEAKRRQPDYPFTQNTASEAVWALGEALLGTESALEDWIGCLYRSHQMLADIRRVTNDDFVTACSEWPGLVSQLDRMLSSVEVKATKAWAEKRDAKLAPPPPAKPTIKT